MATTQSKFGRRFDEEFKREVVALVTRPGSSDTQVARDLNVSPPSVGRWKKLSGPAPPAASGLGVSVVELERRIRSLERENADPRERRIILSLNRSPGLLVASIKLFPAGLHPRGVLGDTHPRQRLPLARG